jgi:hypothetical protein
MTHQRRLTLGAIAACRGATAAVSRRRPGPADDRVERTVQALSIVLGTSRLDVEGEVLARAVTEAAKDPAATIVDVADVLDARAAGDASVWRNKSAAVGYDLALRLRAVLAESAGEIVLGTPRYLAYVDVLQVIDGASSREALAALLERAPRIRGVSRTAEAGR